MGRKKATKYKVGDLVCFMQAEHICDHGIVVQVTDFHSNFKVYWRGLKEEKWHDCAASFIRKANE